jgi:hypothetical protein
VFCDGLICNTALTAHLLLGTQNKRPFFSQQISFARLATLRVAGRVTLIRFEKRDNRGITRTRVEYNVPLALGCGAESQ